MEPAFGSGQVLRSALQLSAPNDAWTAIILVAGAHLLAIWGLFQVEAVRVAVRDVAPTLVEFIVAAPPTAEPVPPPPRPTVRPQALTPTRPVVATAATPEAPTATSAAPTPEPAPAAMVAPPSPPAVAPAPAEPAPAPAAPRVLPATAVRYLVQPPIEVPALSRRLGEQGTVWLRVRVGRDGLPQQISLQTSSGYERLDRQAQDAMRAARFKPQTENGQAIEWIVTAPLRYDIE